MPEDRPRYGTANQAGLLRLMSWLSPAFPVGSFSYSHGLEQAVETGFLTDLPGVVGWVAAILRQGAARIDAALFLEAHRAVTLGDRGRLAAIIELADAWRGTAETALESRSQGRAFVTTLQKGWPIPALDIWLAGLESPPYALAVAVAAAAVDIGEDMALAAFLQAVAANLVSAAVRLIPLGQTDGQRAIRILTDLVPELVVAAGEVSFDDLGTATPMVDWTSMRHETQYTRLFRS
ncbi:urease accessory protein UreF [Telmatospirillum sp.]|uniref:urease accessory protein UreF n=1 Tax=Telmatospirillum sp. TaxID=2079197 RepID=UPI0028509905|nr:urease accessory protein UreF [Telmatospirillum sp.]MDR3439795.1 urease accessory protein UreF [Telmatospirillum sp.]